MTVDLIQGDCLETLKTLPDQSVQCCVTSPPYYGLRDYGVEGQIGLEETPEAYVAKLVAVFREVKRVLKDDGTVFLNLGDSYWGGKGKSGYELPNEAEERRANGETFQTAHNIPGYMDMRPTDGKHPVIKPKDFIGIPWMVAFALRADGWWLRSDIIWHKPNPMPESVTDRPTKSHEYIFLLAKAQKYYYDAEAIAEPCDSVEFNGDGFVKHGKQAFSYNTNKPDKAWAPKNLQSDGQQPNSFHVARANGEKDRLYPTRNKRDVWTVTTKPYKEAHFATFPPDLIEPCILAGSRIGDTILDPFSGAGTTGLVAIRHNRNYIGIELNPEYVEMTKKRLAEIQPVLFQE